MTFTRLNLFYLFLGGLHYLHHEVLSKFTLPISSAPLSVGEFYFQHYFPIFLRWPMILTWSYMVWVSVINQKYRLYLVWQFRLSCIDHNLGYNVLIKNSISMRLAIFLQLLKTSWDLSCIFKLEIHLSDAWSTHERKGWPNRYVWKCCSVCLFW